jgi:DNA helicase II / ATP-dependent DNA helicase PcrA
MQLNPEQLEAIHFRDGAANVCATAGAGKTTVLVERTRALFQEGATPNDVLILTFTVEAAKNLEKRLGLTPAKSERGGFRTFHSFCLNLVRQEARYLPYGLSADPFPDGPVLSKMLLAAMKENGIRRKEYDAVKSFISQRKRHRVRPDGLISDIENPYAQAYSLYEQRLRDGGMLDFDGMIVEAVNLLENNPPILERWQFKWVMADEAQDTDDLQFRLLQLLTEKHKNILVVGDFCQALYGFRGANPENLVHFANWFPNAKTLILPENFRSTQEITEFSKKNAPLKNALTENIRTANSSGPQIEFRMYSGANEEAEATLANAAQDPGNSAILSRTNNQLGVYETLALQHNIKFHLLGRSGLWNKAEIKSLVNLAGFCMVSRQPERYSEQLVATYRSRIRQLPPEQGLREIIRVSNLESLYSNDDYSEDENFAITNLRTVADLAKKFSSLGEFLNHARKAAHASRKSKNAVALSTVHQAKGLEWKNVFVIGVQAGKMPHERGDPAEEARIFYVAITRPQNRLRISFAGTPSAFIASYLTPDIQKELQTSAQKVETLQKQQELFS